MRRLPATLVRELDIEHHPEGRALHVASGSGLAPVGTRLYVAIDDELHIGAFDLGDLGAGRLLRVFPGELPAEHRARKSAKPDIESIVCVPDERGSTLVGVPSGSADSRSSGFAVQLDRDGRAHSDVHAVDWRLLLSTIASTYDDQVNVEGAAVRGADLLLSLRGVTGSNRIARLDVDRVRAALERDRRIDQSAFRDIVPVELGLLDGVPLGFTDAEALDDGRLVVTASAEDTHDAYEDGFIVGSVVLLLDETLCIADAWRLDASVGKVEGVAVELVRGSDIDLLLVTDDDDVARPARLYRATLAT